MFSPLIERLKYPKNPNRVAETVIFFQIKNYANFFKKWKGK